MTKATKSASILTLKPTKTCVSHCKCQTLEDFNQKHGAFDFPNTWSPSPGPITTLVLLRCKSDIQTTSKVPLKLQIIHIAKMSKERKHDVDFILDELVGGGGWWQWKMILLSLPISWASLYALFITMYAAYSPPHRCYIPTCDSASSSINESWIGFALPSGQCLLQSD